MRVFGVEGVEAEGFRVKVSVLRLGVEGFRGLPPSEGREFIAWSSPGLGVSESRVLGSWDYMFCDGEA